MLRNHAPESASVRGADGFAFVQDRSVSMEERAIDDVGVANDPTDVGSGPENVTGIDAINIFHRPFKGNGMAAVITDNAFGFAGGAGGVEDVERISGGDGHAIVRLCGGDSVGPIKIATRE